tara:strand:+ start:36 stop:479 length:444 start_codon:yes stop_codon:yes gene_type:complete
VKLTKQLSLFNDKPLKIKINKTKLCIKCNVVKPLKSFPWQSGEKKFKRANCRSCDLKLNKVRNTLKFKHGLPPENYTCPICLGNEKTLGLKGGKKAGVWCLDHSHDTDKFRGWLCHLCNRAIGFLKDDINNMKRAIKYLEGGSNETN